MNPDGSATSRVFKLREIDNEELSLNVKSLTTPQITITNPEKFFLFELPNSGVLKIGLECFHHPIPDGSNDAHAIICGMTMDDDIYPGQLARLSRRVIIP